MISVFRKELKLYFSTPLAYVFIAAFLAIMGFFFDLFNLRPASTDFRALFDILFTISVLLLPLLTMRSFSEERKQKSDVLYLTAPIDASDVIAGKFLAALTVFMISLSSLLFFGFFASRFGKVDWPLFSLHLLGIFLLGSALMALGIFLSSLTENQIIAAVGTIAFGLALMLLDTLLSSVRWPLLVQLLQSFSMRLRFRSFTLGVLSISDIVYFVAFTVLFLALSTERLSHSVASTPQPSAGKVRVAVKILTYSLWLLLFFSAVFFTDRLAQHHNLQKDMTKAQVFRLSREGTEALKEIKEPLEILVLARKDTWLKNSDYNAQVLYIMEAMVRENPHLSIQYIDYTANPEILAEFPELKPKLGDFIIHSKHTSELLPTESLFNYDKGPDGRIRIRSSRAETTLLQSFFRLTTKKEERVVFLHGHGEARYENLETALQHRGMIIQRLNPLLEEIPADTRSLVSIAPLNDYSDEVLQRIDHFLKAEEQRSFFYFCDIGQKNMDELNTYIRRWGILIKEGSIFETDEKRVFQYQPYYPLASREVDEMLDLSLSGEDRFLVCPLATPLASQFEFQNAYRVLSQLSFSETAGIRPANAEEFNAKDSDESGPFPAALLSSFSHAKNQQHDPGRDSQLFVFSSARMLEPLFFDNQAMLNRDYILNAFDQISAGRKLPILKDQSLSASTMSVDSQTSSRFASLVSIILPLLLLAAGLIIPYKRRRAI